MKKPNEIRSLDVPNVSTNANQEKAIQAVVTSKPTRVAPVVFVLCDLYVRWMCGAAGTFRHPTAINEAIRQTNEQELLLALVRTLYQDSSVYLPVSNVTSQLETSVGASFEGGTDRDLPNRLGTARIGFSDRPTVVFSPAGEQLALQIATPLTLEQLELLSRGYALRNVYRLFVNHVNGLDNASTADGPPPPTPPQCEEYLCFAELLSQLQRQQAILFETKQRAKDLDYVVPLKSIQDIVTLKKEGFSVRKAETGNEYIVNDVEISQTMRLRVDHDTIELVNAFQDLLKLDGDLDTYELAAVPGQFPTSNPAEQNATLNITTRSLLQTAYFVSQGIDVSQQHIDCGLVRTTRNPDGSLFDWDQVLGDLFHVHCCKRKPKHARVAVKYRDCWFYIADSDVASIGTLRLLDAAFGLQGVRSAGKDINAPVLTLSAGR